MTIPAIPTVRIGQTALAIPRIGVGTAPLAAGTAYKAGVPVGEVQASAVIHAALEAGMGWFDIAPYYGGGLAETYVGTALTSVPRSRYMLSTKGGRYLEADEGTRFDFSREGIVRSVEERLQRLQVTSVEILLLHDPDEFYREVLDVAFPTLVDLRQQGVVKAIGAGMNQWQMLADFARFADPDCLLLAGQYTLFGQEALAEFLPLCQTRGNSVLLAGVFNGGILASGAVAGAYYKYAPASAAALARVQQLEQICAQYQVPLAAAALQFPLAHPAVTALVIGAESPAEVRNFRAALSTPIPPACWEALRNAGTLAQAAPVPTAPFL